MAAFKPGNNNTTAHAVATTTAATQFAVTAMNHNCLVSNSGTVSAYINVGTDNTVTAVLPGVFASQGSLELVPGSCQVLTLNGNWIATICASGSTSITICRGDGT